jgi:hypothetical protein
MHRTIIGLSITLSSIGAAAHQYRQRRRLAYSSVPKSQYDELQCQLDQLTTAQRDNRAEINAELAGRYLPQIAHLKRRANRLPVGDYVREVNTPIGTFCIMQLGGYYGDSAVFVYFPQGVGMRTDIVEAFHKAMNGKFYMDPAPGSSNGGDDLADAIITAGLDWDAYQRGEKGYFKCSESPQLDDVARVLTNVITQPIGCTTTV